jgi:hypothetical protein
MRSGKDRIALRDTHVVDHFLYFRIGFRRHERYHHHGDKADRHADDGEPQMVASSVSHQSRVEELTSCEDSLGLAPCKMGDIIIEAATGRPVDVWRSD